MQNLQNYRVMGGETPIAREYSNNKIINQD